MYRDARIIEVEREMKRVGMAAKIVWRAQYPHPEIRLSNGQEVIMDAWLAALHGTQTGAGYKALLSLYNQCLDL
jgi:hypothetical protein